MLLLIKRRLFQFWFVYAYLWKQQWYIHLWVSYSSVNHQHSEQYNGSSYHVVDHERWILHKWRTEHWKAILFQTWCHEIVWFNRWHWCVNKRIRNSHIFIDGVKCAKRVKYLISCICNWNNFNEGWQKHQLHDKSIKLTEIGFSSANCECNEIG